MRAILVLWCLLSADSFALAQEPKPEKLSEAKIAKLIQQLGDANFAQREAATKRLENLGDAALEQLKGAIDSANVEIRQRAVRLLELQKVREIQLKILNDKARVEDFLEGRGSAQDFSYPGWNRYWKVAGDSEFARHLFWEMQKAEPRLIAAYENDPHQAGELLAKRWSYHIRRAERRKEFIPIAPFAAFMLVAGDSDVQIPTSFLEGFTLNYAPLQYPGEPESELHFREVVRIPIETNLPYLALIARWISRRPQGVYQMDETEEKLCWAKSLNSRESGLTLATDLLREHREGRLPWIDGGNGFFWMELLHGIGLWGDRRHIELVEPLLNSQELRTVSSSPDVPLSDYALALLVRLSGQSWEDFGIHACFNEESGFECRHPIEPLFKNDQDRQAALAKWHAWRQENPSEKAKEVAK